jgi:hypothetical protein
MGPPPPQNSPFHRSRRTHGSLANCPLADLLFMIFMTRVGEHYADVQKKYKWMIVNYYYHVDFLIIIGICYTLKDFWRHIGFLTCQEFPVDPFEASCNSLMEPGLPQPNSKAISLSCLTSIFDYRGIAISGHGTHRARGSETKVLHSKQYSSSGKSGGCWNRNAGK